MILKIRWTQDFLILTAVHWAPVRETWETWGYKTLCQYCLCRLTVHEQPNLRGGEETGSWGCDFHMLRWVNICLCLCCVCDPSCCPWFRPVPAPVSMTAFTSKDPNAPVSVTNDCSSTAPLCTKKHSNRCRTVRSCILNDADESNRNSQELPACHLRRELHSPLWLLPVILTTEQSWIKCLTRSVLL